jgi:hypothetical protein
MLNRMTIFWFVDFALLDISFMQIAEAESFE